MTPSRHQIHPAELALLRRTSRPGDAVALYEGVRGDGQFRFVGPASPSQVAPPTVRGRRLVGFVSLETGIIAPVGEAVAA